MGCKGPKSLVELSNGMNFLEFVLRQHEVNINKILIYIKIYFSGIQN